MMFYHTLLFSRASAWYIDMFLFGTFNKLLYCIFTSSCYVSTLRVLSNVDRHMLCPTLRVSSFNKDRHMLCAYTAGIII